MGVARVCSVCPMCDDGIDVGEDVVLEDGIEQHSDCSRGFDLLLAGT